jgi:MFS family permease
MCLGLFMALLDTTIVNIAVPSIIEGLDAKFDEILWVLNAYILAYAALLITGGVQERLRGGDAPDPRCAHRDSVAGRLELPRRQARQEQGPTGAHGTW